MVRNFDGTITITDRVAGCDGQDTILDVEFFSFAGSTLSLADMLNNGTGIKLADGKVFENSSADQSAGTLSVTNPDGSSRHTFQLLDVVGASSFHPTTRPSGLPRVTCSISAGLGFTQFVCGQRISSANPSIPH